MEYLEFLRLRNSLSKKKVAVLTQEFKSSKEIKKMKTKGMINIC